jgi:hypothetical protein
MRYPILTLSKVDFVHYKHLRKKKVRFYTKKSITTIIKTWLLADAAPSEAPLYQTLNVIEDQPLLKIKSTSLLHGAVMLFEGEM